VIKRIFQAAGLLLTVTTVVFFPASRADSQGGYDRPTGYHRVIQWKSPTATARGLMLFTSDAPGLAKRVLISTPTNRHMVLTRMLSVRSGEDCERLVDEQTGWWVEITERRDFLAAGLDEYFAKVHDWIAANTQHETRFTLRTSDGLDFSATTPLLDQPRPRYRALADALQAEGVAQELRRVLPEGVEEALLFLWSAYEQPVSDSRAIIDTLAFALGTASAEGDSEWTQINGKATHGLELTDAAKLAFASEFSSIDPREPLAPSELSRLARGPHEEPVN